MKKYLVQDSAAMLPYHIAIIMDGNGRWARARDLPRTAGHKAGMEALRTIVWHARVRGLRWLTLYAFSYLVELHKKNIKIHVIGERRNLTKDIIALFCEAETLTSKNTGLNLVVAFNYSGRNEIVRAVKSIAIEVEAGRIKDSDIDDRLFASHMDTALMPDPDLIIRTSGEMRLSNFLLWQAAYSELSFVPCFWPDFSVVDFDTAVAGFCQRKRRFGALEQPQDVRKVV